MGLSDILKDILGLRRGANRDFSDPSLQPKDGDDHDGRRVPRDIEEELMAEFGRWNDRGNFRSDHKDDFFSGQEHILHDLEHILEGFFKGHQLEESTPWWSSDGWKEPAGKQEKSLKEKMLKEPDDKPDLLCPHPGISGENQEDFSPFASPFSMFERFFRIPFGPPSIEHGRQKTLEDQDLDKEFHSGKSSLDDLLSQNDHNNQQNSSRDIFPHSPGMPFQNFSFRSYSQITKRGPDGVVEHQQTIKDADGNEEVIISRTIGDQRHTYRKRLDKDGNEEIQEDIVDLPEVLQPGNVGRESIFGELFGKPEGFAFEWKWP